MYTIPVARGWFHYESKYFLQIFRFFDQHIQHFREKSKPIELVGGQGNLSSH